MIISVYVIRRRTKKLDSKIKVLEVIEVEDPWKGIKSPYGGKMSPEDEYNYMRTGEETKITLLSLEVDQIKLAIDSGKLYSSKLEDIGSASCIRDDGTIRAVDRLRIASCDLESIELPLRFNIYRFFFPTLNPFSCILNGKKINNILCQT